MALFRDGLLVAVLERRDIENSTAEQTAERLAVLFAEYC
jgi:putative YphP/YqiW family bacilliredoxin